ncbi:YceI-like domain-containing protein [Chitinophaga skermanii]|uniref:YceI-like domain-containing protein n=1 Tax=Chitinophaga skermanii TaxID=331697 RepID=A0A327QQN7_9BACT|nr:YceI family protein [Chitinophaga skermanii]RAJ04107.1 YceI-like domain-containing protein [Chitinophaga skermanii]
MKACLWLCCLLFFTLHAAAQNIFSAKNVASSFFSKAPLEDIDAHSKSGVSAINVQARTVFVQVPINSFEFKKSLMQEHFNENYMESDKYPNAIFKGRIVDEINLATNGTYTATVTGNLLLHGVDKTYSEKVTFTVNNGKINAVANFKVKLADHKIKIPTIVFKNIAEVVDVSIEANYLPYSK